MCSRNAGQKTWSSAVRACSNLKAELPYPSSPSDFRQLTSHIEEHYATSSFFLEFSDSEYEGVWKTEDNKVKFSLETLWDQQKPGGQRGDDFMVSSKRRKNSRWLLSDVDNEYEATAICVRDREPEIACGWKPSRLGDLGFLIGLESPPAIMLMLDYSLSVFLLGIYMSGGVGVIALTPTPAFFVLL